MLSIRPKDGADILLFSNPKSQRRERLTVRASQDGGQTWSNGLLIYGGSAAYSDLVQINEKTVGLLFERDFTVANPGFQGGGEELYDPTKDPHEWNNLAGKKEYRRLMDDLSRYMPMENADQVPDL